MAPIDINNQEISSITLNGNTEINTVEVNGQEVFSAQTLPVAYSNLIAWYPFDSATYGGSNADDVTAILGGSGDDTAYDGTVNGATYQSSGGVTDINAGVNSGAFDFDGSNDSIQTSWTGSPGELSITCWLKISDFNNIDDRYQPWSLRSTNGGSFQLDIFSSSSVGYFWGTGAYSTSQSNVSPANTFLHFAVVGRSNSSEIFVDGNSVLTGGGASNLVNGNPFQIAEDGAGAGEHYDGVIDDFRVYNKALSQSEINQIIQNTEP